MSEKTGLFARLFSRTKNKKELCCGIELEEFEYPSPPAAAKPNSCGCSSSAKSVGVPTPARQVR
jgi:hypothetical protein